MDSYPNLTAAHGLKVSRVCPGLSQTSYLSVAEYNFDEQSDQATSFRHKHDEYEFVIPLKTISLLHYDKAAYIGEVGFIYPVNPGVMHGLEYDFNNGHFYDIVIDRTYLDTMKEELGYSKDTYFYARFFFYEVFINLIHFFQILSCEGNAPQEKIDYYASNICRFLIEEGLSVNEDLRKPEKQHAPKIRKVILYMHEHFREQDLTVEKLAELSGYSPSHFSKAFKLYMNDTPVGHLIKLRLSESRYLLHSTNMTFNEIAHACGFRNVSTFTENFKRKIGMLPKEYRKMYSHHDHQTNKKKSDEA